MFPSCEAAAAERSRLAALEAEALLARPRRRSCCCGGAGRARLARVGRAGQPDPRADAALHARSTICCWPSSASPWSRPAATASDEPICTDERRGPGSGSRGIADLFLVHDRPIVRPVDDSVVRLVAGRGMLLRRARGYAPLPVATSPSELPPMLAVGGHLKNTVALSVGRADLPRASTSATSTRRRPCDAFGTHGRDPVHGSTRSSPKWWRATCIPTTPRRGSRDARGGAGRRGPAPPRPRAGRAWPRTRSRRRSSASPGTAAATARTARSGAASSCA